MSAPEDDDLKQQLALANTSLVQANEQIAALEKEVKLLRLKLDNMARRLFGRSSEKLDESQLQLVMEQLLQEEKKEEAKKPVSSGGESNVPEGKAQEAPPRKRRSLEDLIAGLPVEEVVEDPAEVKREPERWECIGTEQTQLIDYIPARFRCLRLVGVSSCVKTHDICHQ